MNGNMYRFLKRTYDIVLTSVALLILLPLLLMVMIVLRFSGERQVFYTQERVGYQCSLFKMYKFATMLKNSYLMDGGWVTTSDDPRTTPVGKILRKTKFNELPQLINVLAGDMSIVGPRPAVKTSFVDYPQDVKTSLYSIKPGLTSIASIVFRGEEELITNVVAAGRNPIFFYNTVIYPYKGELEQWYREKQSILVDFKIIMLTCWVIIFPKTDLVNKVFPDAPILKLTHIDGLDI